MLPAGHFPGQSPSHLPRRCAPCFLFPAGPTRDPLVRVYANLTHFLDHPANCGLLPYLEALFDLSCYTLLWGPHSAGTLSPLKEY